MERIKCKGCGEFLVKADVGYGIADEKALVTTFKMISRLGSAGPGAAGPLDDMDEYRCGACGKNSFEIVSA